MSFGSRAQVAGKGLRVDLGVLVPENEIDGVLSLDDHIPGGYLFRDKINLEAFPPVGGRVVAAQVQPR